MGGFLISRGKIHKPPQEVVLMTEEQKNVVIKRRNSGFGYATIAKEIGLTKDAVVAFCRRNGLTGNMAGKVPEETGSRCKECGLCAANCPKGAISFAEHPNAAGYHPAVIDAGACIACGSCEHRCPFGVPAVENMRLAAELFGA